MIFGLIFGKICVLSSSAQKGFLQHSMGEDTKTNSQTIRHYRERESKMEAILISSAPQKFSESHVRK